MAIIQEKNKTKWTKDGRNWYFDVYYKNIYGELKEKKSKYYKTKTEAKEAEREFLNSINQHTYTDNITFKELFREWIDFKSAKVKISSLYSIEKGTTKYILPYFEKFNHINDITVNSLLDFKEKLENNPISLKRQNAIIGYLIEILLYACDNYNFDKKIVVKLQKHRIDVSEKENDTKWNFWTYEEFNQFIKVVDDKLYFIIFNFLYFTGLRLGEFIALKWKNVDLEKGYINIKDNFTYGIKEKEYAIISPKTKNSIRTVELDDNLISLLKKHLEHEKKFYGFNMDMFVFGNIKHISPTTLRNALYKYIELANVKKITPHGFRHSHVSLLIHLGCDSRDVSERIGDTVQMIERTYYHMFPSKKEKTLQLLNDLKKI